MTNFEDVKKFHKKFGLGDDEQAYPFHAGPREVSKEWMKFRIAFLKEELKELEEAYAEGNEAGMADALIDLNYVSMGTALGRGYPWEALWTEVQGANMRKVAGETKRGVVFDVTKPPGWKPPRIELILESYGFGKQLPTGC